MSDGVGSDETPVGNDPGVGTELDKNIGLLGAVAIGVGTMIAAGIFVLSGLAVSKVGTVAIISFFLAAMVASITAAAYAEFSSIYEESGGGYMYVSNTFESDLTYFMGWTMILGYPASAAFYLASFSEWFYRFIFPVLHIPRAIPYWIPGLVILALLVGLNFKGTEESNQFQIAVTALKVLLIALFLYGGLQTFETDVVATSFTQHIDDFAQMGVTSALVFITFFGFSAIATNAEEVKQPGWTIPRAIYISMGFVTFVYTLVVLVIVLAINTDAFLGFLATQTPEIASASAAPAFIASHGEVAMAFAAQYYLGDIGFYIIVVGALFSMLSASNATILAGSRVKLALARRNHLPQGFEDLHPTANTPYKTVVLTGGFILIYLIVFTVIFGEEYTLFGLHLGIEGIAQFANFLLISGLTFVNVALIYSRRKYPDVDRGFTVPFVPWLPILGILANLVLLVNVGVTAIVGGLIAEAIGIAVWFIWKSRLPTTEAIEREIPTVVAEHNPSNREYQLLVPIANPENTEQLMRTAADIAADQNGEILVTSVVTLPEQTPLHRGRQYADEKRDVVNSAMESAEEADVPVSATIRIAHDAGDAILNTIDQYESDAVLLGWKGQRSRRRDIVLGTTVDKVVTAANCDVLVEKIGAEADGVDSILLPTAGGPHAELAAETARAIAHSEGSTVYVVQVIRPGATESEREDAQENVQSAMDILDGVENAHVDLLESDGIADTIVEESENHDLMVIGATREGLFQQLVFGAIPEDVGAQTQTTVIMTKRDLDIASRISRWFRRDTAE